MSKDTSFSESKSSGKGPDIYKNVFEHALALFKSENFPSQYMIEQLKEFESKIPDKSRRDWSGIDARTAFLMAVQEILMSENDLVREELEQTRNQYEDILIILGHEFKNLLTSASGYNSLLEKKLHDEKKSDLVEIQQASNHVIQKLFHLIDSVLKMVQGEKHILKPDYRLMDLEDDIIDPLVREIAGELQTKNMHISKKNIARKTMLLADEQLLAIVVRNLLENAVKYGDEGSEINIVIANIKDRIAVSIENKCRYIPDNICDGIFEKFNTIKLGNIAAGTGIGLYNVKNLIELHGGSVSCSSKKGKWIRFKFELLNNPDIK